MTRIFIAAVIIITAILAWKSLDISLIDRPQEVPGFEMFKDRLIGERR